MTVTTITPDPDLAERAPVAPAATDRLTAETAKLRSRRALTPDRWFQLAGAVLPVLGLLAIVVAWYGVAHTARLWRQTPYLVSGGLLGLGLIFLGGFGYFAFWMTKFVEESRHQTAILERIEAALAAEPPHADTEAS